VVVHSRALLPEITSAQPSTRRSGVNDLTTILLYEVLGTRHAAAVRLRGRRQRRARQVQGLAWLADTQHFHQTDDPGAKLGVFSTVAAAVGT
jgi:hypothetical protein